jgi:hypothetical protein
MTFFPHQSRINKVQENKIPKPDLATGCLSILDGALLWGRWYLFRPFCLCILITMYHVHLQQWQGKSSTSSSNSSRVICLAEHLFKMPDVFITQQGVHSTRSPSTSCPASPARIHNCGPIIMLYY